MDIKILGNSVDANTPIDDILGAIRINPEPEIIIEDEPEITLDPEPLTLGVEVEPQTIEPNHTFTLTHEQAKMLANSTIAEGKRWAMETFGIEDEYVALTVASVGIGLHRGISDLGLLVNYKITFSME